MARRRRGVSEMPHADERWLITYADMITLLLAVFVVLYALSDTNLKKFTAFAESMANAFDTKVFVGRDATSVSTGQGTGATQASTSFGGGIVGADMRSIRAAVGDAAIARGQEGSVSVERVADGIAIRISTSLLFRSGRAVLDDSSVDLVGAIARIIGGLPNEIRVEGHTDDLPPTGSLYADNWALSSARALAVLHALHDAGVADRRLAAAGYGPFHPLTAGVSDEDRARNRRVDVLVLYPGHEPGAPEATPTANGDLPFQLP